VTSSSANHPHVLWHHAVHLRAGESLYFWRLGFYPIYDARAVETGLREVLSDAGVRSAVCYELFGPYDILLRVWLPSTERFDEFQEALIERLARVNLNMCDPFQVARPVRHWLFSHEGSALEAPDDAGLEALDNLALVRELESGSAPTASVEKLARQRVLAPFREHRETTDRGDPGTKFAVVVSGDPRLTTSQHKQFEQTLTALLDGAARLKQRSLYSGSGFGHFLVMGLVKGEPLSVLTEDLLEPINEAEIATNYGARTFTHVSGRADYVFIRETLLDTIARSDARPTPAAAAASSEEPTIGKVFAGRFLVESEIGRGAFSQVYEVFDEVEKAVRALKVFVSVHADEQIRREIAYLRKVQDPRVMKVFWADRTSDGRWYLVSEYIQGATLDEIITQQKLTASTALEIGEDLLSALVAIHPNERRINELKRGELTSEQFEELQELLDAGFVHRDIKPNNIMWGNAGLKLLDFNIASHAGEMIETRSGTPPYQPPEGDLAIWDVTTDLFAAGVVIYELVTGEYPYVGGFPRSDQQPQDPRSFRPDLPLPLVHFLIQATAARRDERFQSAVEMRRALAIARRQAEIDTHAEPRAFGVRVRSERERSGLSVTELAERADLGASVVEAIELGEVSPTLTDARALAQGLEVGLGRLLGTDER
jgi:DNA-binding XRE family transcriptional regulator